MHSLLKRQLKRHLGDAFSIPAEWQAFLRGINEAYLGFDADRALLEHSLELSSQELLEANSEMRAVFQAIPDLVFRLSHHGTILDVKAGASSELMVGRQELVGKQLVDTPLRDDAAHFAAAMRRVIAENLPVSIEYAAVRHGQESDYEARLVPLPENQIVVIIRNITERKQSLRLLAAAVEQSTESITITDTELDSPGPRILFVNPAFTTMSGYTAGEVLGRTPRILQGPRSDRALMRRLRETLGRGEIFKGETVNYRKDGTEFNIEWEVTPIRNSSGLITHFLGIQRDISPRKRAEAFLIENRQRLALATESAHIGIWDWNVVANKLVWDQQMYALYGIGEPDFTGAVDAWQKGLHPEDRNRAEGALAAALAGNKDFDGEFRVVWPNGEVHDIEAHGVVQRAGDGSALRMIGVNWDITARKQAERELAQAHTRLLTASRLAGMAEVATGILHNVGNVLNSVNVASTCVADRLRKSKSVNLFKVTALLREHDGDLGDFLANDSKGRQVPDYLAQLAEQLAGEQAGALKELAQLQQNIEHIRAILRTQQSLARISGVPEPVTVTELVQDALNLNLSGTTRNDIEIVKACGEVPPVLVEKHKALQILVNLVRNAQQSCEASGRPGKKMTICTTASDGRARIAVTDNGVGIPSENLTRIFAHGFTTKKNGHGFGLHSSALAARELGGSLTVHSDGSGHGATFILELPCNSDVPAP